MGNLRPVTIDWLDSAPVRATAQHALHHPPDAVFAALADDPAGWGRWFPGFADDGRYIDPPPHGVGSARQVRLGPLRITERILAWDSPTRWAFYVERCSGPSPQAMAEDYRLAAAPGGSTLTWTFALDPGRVPPAVFSPLHAVLDRVMRRFCARLDAALDAGLDQLPPTPPNDPLTH